VADQLDVSSSNWSTGTGVIDSYNSLITDIKNAHDEDKAQAAVEIGVAAVGAVIDTVSTVLNPLSKLIAAGLGWLIEHVEFLRKPLDLIAGNPTAIGQIADELHKIGQDLRNTATDLDGELSAQLSGWTGQAADAYRSTLAGRKSDIDGAGQSVDTVGYVVETTMAIISAVRSLIRDMITSTLGDIISTMLIALATAPFTFGASIAVGVTKCVVEGVAKVAEMMAKLAKLLGFSAKAMKHIDDLVSAIKKAAGKLGDKHASLMDKYQAGKTGGAAHAADDGASTHSSDSAHSGSDAGSDADSVYHDAPEHPGDDAASTHSDDSDGDSVYHDAEEHPGADDGGSTHTQDSDEPADDAASQHSGESHESDESTESTEDDGASQHSGESTEDDAASQHSDDSSEDGDSVYHDAQEEPDPPAAPPKSHDSLLKPFDDPRLKAHEDWLKQLGLGDELNKTKTVENYFKNNHPAVFQTLKTISDLKSSKNQVGLVDKYVTQLVKQLGDIHEKAQSSWDDANQQWQQDHPGAATAPPPS
jgi:uncharacterized protein YukE